MVSLFILTSATTIAIAIIVSITRCDLNFCRSWGISVIWVIYIYLINHLKALFLSVDYDIQSSEVLIHWLIQKIYTLSVVAMVYFHPHLEECSLIVSHYFSHWPPPESWHGHSLSHLLLVLQGFSLILSSFLFFCKFLLF